MITIHYTRDGCSMSDFNIETFALSLSEVNGDIELQVSTETLILAIRTLIAEGKLDYRNFKFKYDDIVISVNEYGRLDQYPKGFEDLQQSFISRILKATSKKKIDSEGSP